MLKTSKNLRYMKCLIFVSERGVNLFEANKQKKKIIIIWINLLIKCIFLKRKAFQNQYENLL